MSTAEIFLIAVGLAMDAFAVSIGNGIVLKSRKKCVLAAALCGVFQAAMPFIGYIVGAAAQGLISRWDHWIALLALGFIGGKMFAEAITDLRKQNEDVIAEPINEPTFALLVMQAVATSIDALVVGVSLAAVGANIASASTIIGITAFVICLGGVFFGRRLGSLFGTRAAAFGGVVLLLIGIKTFAEHTLLT